MQTLLMPMRDSFGVRLRRTRNEQGFSQEDLAAAANLSRPTIANAEADRNVRVDTVFQLARVLEVSPAYLLFGIEQAEDGEWPSLGHYLYEAFGFTPDQIAAVRRTVQAFQAEHELRTLREEQLHAVAEEPASYTPEPEDVNRSNELPVRYGSEPEQPPFEEEPPSADPMAASDMEAPEPEDEP